MTCDNCGRAIPVYRRGDLHSQNLCAACTTAYTWGYLASARRAEAQDQAEESAPFVLRWLRRRRARGNGMIAASDTGPAADVRRYETFL